ncbi:hypothetical protein QVD17_04774 [Tagetes erecta]|uniref:Uncharacterized protein n=1 Tax=Tagetes erecta TaxID=13708 RepID=A0AAD8PAX7_TARER|nr:hypothetical protein QVD17_04774 [Tagetes erecta]
MDIQHFMTRIRTQNQNSSRFYFETLIYSHHGLTLSPFFLLLIVSFITLHSPTFVSTFIIFDYQLFEGL